MLLNFLGKGHGRLYTTEDFLQPIAIEQLFGPETRAEHFNDDRLARGLDEIAKKDPSSLFTSIM
jgi:hypothetical protein